jgi:hypothetical protein
MESRLAKAVAASSAALLLLLAGGAAAPGQHPSARPAPRRGAPTPYPRRVYPHSVPRTFIPPAVVPFVGFGFYYQLYAAPPATYPGYSYPEYEPEQPEYEPPPDMPTPPPDPFYEELPVPDEVQ